MFRIPLLALILVVLIPVSTWGAGPQTADVFVPQTDGFASIRIPSVIVTEKGTILAFAEGRAADADQAKKQDRPQTQLRWWKDMEPSRRHR